MSLTKEECEQLEYEHKQDMIREAAMDYADERYLDWKRNNKTELAEQFAEELDGEFDSFCRDQWADFKDD